MASLEDKVVIITGSGAGIGQGIALHLAQFNVKLVLVDIKVDRNNETSQQCQAIGLSKDKILTLGCDVRKEEDLQNVVDTTIKTFGSIYGLVNNAGVGINQSIENLDMDNYDNTMRVNLRAPVYLSKLCIPYLKQSKGSVVNMSSILSQRGYPLLPVYSMTKAALNHFTHLFAAEMAEYGVRCNCICPGYTRSEFRANAGIVEPPDIHATQSSIIPLKRIGEPEDVGKLVKFLLSEESSYITGEEIRIDGGRANPVFQIISK
ncbi:hypothetical protein SNE40_000507 [Patella caerulea]|uniref:Uncharacterized protein n=1 Tax=Patella caerulea TaxID=87958 RepID=A0AAN8KAL5_PATCE